ncbi:unnamed protein product, partial [Rotaria sordida]
ESEPIDDSTTTGRHITASSHTTTGPGVTTAHDDHNSDKENEFNEFDEFDF